MVLHKLPQFTGVHPQDNKVSAFGIKVDFAEGALAEHCYAPSNTNALWALIGAASSLGDKVFFEIEREDIGLKFQGYGQEEKFCLFQDTYQHELKIFGSPSINPKNLDLVQIWDMRWELTYFLPNSAFYSFCEMVDLGTESLQTGQVVECTAFSQSFSDLNLPDGYC